RAGAGPPTAAAPTAARRRAPARPAPEPASSGRSPQPGHPLPQHGNGTAQAAAARPGGAAGPKADNDSTQRLLQTPPPYPSQWRLAARCVARGKGHPEGLASLAVTSKPRRRGLLQTVTHGPLTHCQICRTVACRPGNLSEVLTGHYRRAHPETP